MPAGRVRAMVRAGICSPVKSGSSLEFSFQDLVLLRAAEGLVKAEVPGRRLRRALRALALKMPGRPLSGVRILAEGREVIVRDGDAAWQPETGQTLLDFEAPAPAASAPAPQASAEPEPPPVATDALAWFERALSLETDDPAAAKAAYEAALEEDPRLADAWVNLGRIAHDGDDAEEAARCYGRAIEIDAGDPVSHYDLALALEDLGRTKEAVARYEKAVELDPKFADAHWNLGRLLVRIGRRAAALRHLAAYKKLTE